jgi:hypothetical protein
LAEGNLRPPTTEGDSKGAIVVGIVLSLLALLLWAVQLATLLDLNGSDAAGNSIARAYGALEIIALWVVLAALMILAAVRGAMPRFAAVAALILIPASGYAAMTALELLADPDVSPFIWPIVVPALVPPLSVAFFSWSLLPSMRARIPATVAGGIAWGGILMLCVSIWPMVQLRHVAIEREAAQRAQRDADFASLPADSPLWAWTPFLATPDSTKEEAVLDRIRHLDRRQSDAEIMLDRGDFPLLFLGSFDLDPTPALCDRARGLLRRRVQPLVPKSPNSRPYTDIAEEASGAVEAMEWLVGYGCPCDAESLAWESMAKAYRDPGFDVFRLAELRDPKNLGRVLREDPARFSMLTPQAHLKAWLKFAEDKGLREQALAGARKLDHRTADAVEMLGGDEHDA